MALIQIIEIRTPQPETVDELIERWVGESDGRRTATRASLAGDVNRSDSYLQIVEFPSVASARANAELPETTAFAQRLLERCTVPPTYRDLQLRRVYDLR